eukprot:5870717-Prorocentrum_lima.AAC.1
MIRLESDGNKHQKGKERAATRGEQFINVVLVTNPKEVYEEVCCRQLESSHRLLEPGKKEGACSQ